MATGERRVPDGDDRRRFIAATARVLAEREGWEAVTTRRLSAEIEYSQPVIYKHFASMEEIVEAVAMEGFAELAQALTKARRTRPAETVASAARAYLRWATKNPVLYDAMFSRPTSLRFAEAASAAPLKAAFSALRAAVEPIAGDRDPDTLTEVLWSALHGLTTLAGNQRLRPDHARQRIAMLVASLAPAVADS